MFNVQTPATDRPPPVTLGQVRRNNNTVTVALQVADPQLAGRQGGMIVEEVLRGHLSALWGRLTAEQHKALEDYNQADRQTEDVRKQLRQADAEYRQHLEAYRATYARLDTGGPELIVQATALYNQSQEAQARGLTLRQHVQMLENRLIHYRTQWEAARGQLIAAAVNETMQQIAKQAEAELQQWAAEAPILWAFTGERPTDKQVMAVLNETLGLTPPESATLQTRGAVPTSNGRGPAALPHPDDLERAGQINATVPASPAPVTMTHTGGPAPRHSLPTGRPGFSMDDLEAEAIMLRPNDTVPGG